MPVNATVSGLGILSDGTLVVCGRQGEYHMFLFMLAPDGTPDYFFNSLFYLPLNDGLYGLTVQDDDKIIVTGHGGSSGFSFARFDRYGSLDISHERMAVVPIANRPARAFVVKVLADGKILLGGKCWNGSDSDFALARLNADGSPDTSFGTGGCLVVDLGGSEDECHSLAIQSDGKIVAGGTANPAGSRQMALIRCQPNGQLDTTYGTAGKTVSSFEVGPRVSVLVRSDNSINAFTSANISTNVPGGVMVHYDAAGVLDTSLGQGGKVEYPLGALGGDIQAACRTTGGKLIAVGSAALSADFGSDFALLRMTEDGVLDDTFRGGVRTEPSFGRSSIAKKSVALPEGKPLVCGSTGEFNHPRMSLARYDAAGDLDATFGNGGLAQADWGSPGGSVGNNMVVQADGRIVVVGSNNKDDEFALARFLADGTLDSSFGDGGKVLTSVGTGWEVAHGVALQPDGKIVVAGAAQNGAHTDFALVRYLPNGALDSLFGNNGIVMTAVGPQADYGTGVALQPDGRILVGGRAWNGVDYDFGMVRYLGDGSLDPDFGNGGKMMTSIGPGDDMGIGMHLLPDGRIIQAGRAAVRAQSGSSYDQALVRYLPNGSLDATFGTGGKVITRVGRVTGSSITGLAVQADGRIVTTGTGFVDSLGGVTVSRYEENGSVDTSFGKGGSVRTALFGGQASGSGVAVQGDGTLLVVGGSSYPSSSGSTWVLARYHTGPLLPLLETAPPQNITMEQSTLTGTVNPNGFATTLQFEYGITTTYGSMVPLTLTSPAATQVQSVSHSLSDLSPGTTYHYRLTATNAAGTRSTSAGSFTTLNLQQGWRLQHFGSAANTGTAADTADFDHDGLPNLIEWACGQNPAGGAPSLLPAIAVGSGGELDFTYDRSVAALNAGAVFIVEWNDDLSAETWSHVGVTEHIFSNNGTLQQIRASLPAGSSGRRFVRLKVLPPP